LKSRSLDDWLAYISAQHPATIALGLDRVRQVGDRMGVTPKAVTPAKAGAQSPVVITVGGTNGKGSTCAFLERIAIEAGYRTGLYTSPHLLRYNERVHVNGEDAADDALCSSFAEVELARGATQLTYFEYGTLAALALFREARLDLTILEVGLGGRLDAVNIVDTDCAIVASVDLDHQAYLGNDRDAIGYEKAGIFRPGKPAIFGDNNPPPMLVAHAAAIGADLQVLGRDFGFQELGPQWNFQGRRTVKRALPLPALRGAWQLRNASSALAALDEVAERLPISLGEVKRGLATVTLAGRLQVLAGRPAIVLDVAHNPHAARALADGLLDMGFFETTTAVFGMLADKDIDGVVEAMRERVDRWFVAAPQAERAASAARLMQPLESRGLAARAFVSIAQALQAARREAGANDRIVVFGSFYTVAEALRSVR